MNFLRGLLQQIQKMRHQKTSPIQIVQENVSERNILTNIFNGTSARLGAGTANITGNCGAVIFYNLSDTLLFLRDAIKFTKYVGRYIVNSNGQTRAAHISLRVDTGHPIINHLIDQGWVCYGAHRSKEYRTNSIYYLAFIPSTEEINRVLNEQRGK